MSARDSRLSELDAQIRSPFASKLSARCRSRRSSSARMIAPPPPTSPRSTCCRAADRRAARPGVALARRNRCDPPGHRDRRSGDRVVERAGADRAAVRGLRRAARHRRGAVVATLLTLRDLTESRRVERMRADFIANASHELRTPLASFLGFIETLQGSAHADAKAREKFLAHHARAGTPNGAPDR